MKYMGSKSRIAKHITPFVFKHFEYGMTYVEPFVGGLNMMDKTPPTTTTKIASDINPYLISMWNELQNGWMPPEFISRDEYNDVRTDYNTKGGKYPSHFIGYVGFSGSYGGRFFDGGYAGITKTKSGKGKSRNYPFEAYNNITKQIPKLNNIDFTCGSYDDLDLKGLDCVIYCDPPYKGTKEYSNSGFDSDKFWDWCNEQIKCGHQVFVSEYEAPSDWVCVWEKTVSSSLRANGIIKGDKKSVERLFTKL
jgi:DNA adenine methylase